MKQDFQTVLFENEKRDNDEFEDDDVPLATLVAQFALQIEDIHNIDQDAKTEDSSDDWEKTLLDNYRPLKTTECDIVEEIISTETLLPGS
jgi:hypothetical protein